MQSYDVAFIPTESSSRLQPIGERGFWKMGPIPHDTKRARDAQHINDVSRKAFVYCNNSVGGAQDLALQPSHRFGGASPVVSMVLSSTS